MHTLAIIGCGATGASLLAQLVDGLEGVAPSHTTPLRVLVFEKSGKLGPGLAFSCHPDLMMNSPAGKVTVFDKDNHHFLRWLASSREKWEPHYPSFALMREFDPEWFTPRALVGIYLNDMFEEYRQQAKEKGIIVDVLYEEVVNMEEDEKKGTSLVTASGDRHHADSVVFATGNICSSPNYSHLASSPSFYASQYVNIDYSAFHGKRVLVLGTSLGAVDTAVLLHDANPNANVVLASKRGRLPSVKSELTEYTYTKLIPAELDSLRAERGQFAVAEVDTLVKSELLESYSDLASCEVFDLPEKEDPVALFEREVEMCLGGTALWQRFQFGWINIADRLWNAMESETEKREFQRYYTNYIHRYTSSFHIDMALKIRTWLRNGSLRIAAIPDPASLKHQEDAGEFSAKLVFGGDGPLEETHFDVVIDASGVSKRFAESAPIFQNLHEKDLAAFNPYGGFDVAGDTLRVRGTEKFSARVYAAGSPTYGSFFYTNFILVSARHTAVIASQIKEAIKGL